jgi:hypothetical protein
MSKTKKMKTVPQAPKVKKFERGKKARALRRGK